MSRPTRPDRLKNPIRQLRKALASEGRDYLNQAQLSEIVDIPVDTIKDLESGRASLSDRVQNRILCETGAAWNKEDELWRFWKVNGPTYAREHYERFRKEIERQEWPISLDVFMAQERIRLLLETLPPKARFKLLFRLNTFLEEARKEFCPEAFEELFGDMSGYIEARPELDRDHPLTVMRGYPHEIFSRLTWDRSLSADDRKKLATFDSLSKKLENRYLARAERKRILKQIEEQERLLDRLGMEARPISFDLTGYQEAIKRQQESPQAEQPQSAET